MENPDCLELFSFLIELLKILVPSISSILLFYLASNKEKRVSKYETYAKRLENYYIPFYQMYCRGFLFERSIGDMSFEGRGQFLDLFSANLQYMDAKTQSFYSSYYRAFLDLLEAEDSDSNDIAECREALSAVFSDIATSTFSEYKRLLRKLKMPIPNI